MTSNIGVSDAKSNGMGFAPTNDYQTMHDNVERALKKFKRKYERTGVLKELRARQYFTKPSIAKREKMAHAIYVEKMHREDAE